MAEYRQNANYEEIINEHEFFAECYAMYKMGKGKRAWKYRKMIKGVLK